ncbi:MAG: InlB B-repeat-containing protein [Lachnospiraceae bacterium]|nr:InlB B-repeat-containing protein [Lachnospiraceae bacterium]
MEISYFSDDHGLRNGFPSANNTKRKNAQCGFSLIELVVVIAIMAVLVGLIAPQFVKYVKTKKDDTCKHNREAILRVYERAVYDGSAEEIGLNSDAIEKVVNGTNKYAYKEVKDYLKCPNNTAGSNKYHAYVMNGSGKKYDPESGTLINQTPSDNTGSACIYCEDCGNVVSIDLLGWANPSQPVGADPTRIAPPIPSPTSGPEEEYTVRFNLNGHGSPKPADQTGLKKGDKAVRPTEPTAATYKFLGWFDDPTDGNEYMFTEEVESDFTLWAHWEGFGGGNKVWPYADDQSWWDPSIISQAPIFDENGNWIGGGHAGYYDPGSTQLNFDAQDVFESNAKVGIITPSGVFTSRSGAQFVYVDTQGNGSAVQLELKHASTPEYYSALFPDRLILLTGNKTVINITGKSNNAYFNHTNPGQYKIPLLTHGDLVEFVDGNTSYMYVYWEGQTTDRVISISEIRSYANHPNGLYRVNKTPTTITN